MIEPTSSLGAVLGLVSGAGMLLIHRRLRARTIRFDDRVRPYVGVGQSNSRLLDDARAVTPFPILEQFLAPWARDLNRRMTRFSGSVQMLELRLDSAGRRQSVEQFRVQQVLCAVLGLAAGLFAAISLHVIRDSPAPVLAAIVLICGALGVVTSDQRLSHQVKRRSGIMKLEFPTIAELFALAVSAGESPVAALERVTSIARGEVLVELRSLLGEIRAGEPITVALERLAARTSLVPLSRFCRGIAVAVERGTPLAAVLRDQAQDVRDSGRRELMEIGGRKEVAMMVPVVFLILPITIVFAVFPSLITLNLGR